MNQTPNTPGDKPVSADHGRGNADGTHNDGTEQRRRGGGSVLWLLLLVALLLLGWWWFSQRGTTGMGEQPPVDATTGEPAAAAAASAEQAAADARKKAAEAQDKPREPSKPVTPRVTDASPMTGRNPQPDYPRDAQRRGLSGRVLLRVDVAADGTATNVDFVQRSGTPELDRAAMNAVRKWQFTPARRDGKATASSVNVPIDFVLPEG
jgi:protein TonB